MFLGTLVALLTGRMERRHVMTARWLTFTGWVVPAPMAALTEWVASRWARKPAKARVDDAPPSFRPMPSGPHPHASARLSLWDRVDLFSRM
jgi:hypothetical protein